MSKKMLDDLLNGELGTKLKKHKDYVMNRYDYYNDEISSNAKSDSIKLSIDNLRNELLVSHFINAKSFERYFTQNILNKVIKSSLISGCGFIRIFENAGKIELIPYDAMYSTGFLNNDNTLSEAITIDKTDTLGTPVVITYFSQKETRTIYSDDREDIVVKNETGVIPVVPIIINQNPLKPFGSSYITKKMMADTKLLKKIKKQSETMQETLSNAHTFLLGVGTDFEAEIDEKQLSLVKDIIAITRNDNGDIPNLVTKDMHLDSIENKIQTLEQSIMYDTTTQSYRNMVEAIRYDLIDSFNVLCQQIIKVMNNDAESVLNGKIDIVFKNNNFNEFSAFMDGVLKVNQVIPGYLAKEQLDSILGINGNKSKLIEALKNEVKEDFELGGE